MGNYNPYAPEILGQEWAPVRDEQTVFSPWVNAVEYGHGFRLETSRILQEARIYVDEIPPNLASQAISAAVYPRGLEAASGPIRRVIIPADSVAVTGVTVSPSALPGAAILLTPNIGGYYLFDTDNQYSVIFIGFNTQEYQVLSGKRILGVNLLYAAHKFFGSAAADIGPQIGIQDSTDLFGETLYSRGNEIPEGGTIGSAGLIRLRFGDRCPYPPAGVTDRVPWIWPTDLGRFDSSSASRLYVSVKTGVNYLSPPAGGIMYFWYAALEVLFCEEQRLAYGIGIPAPAQLAPGEGPDYGANPITLRTLPGRALWPSLQAGDYTVTVAGIDDGNRTSPYTAGMRLNALRELYALPTHPGVQLDLPYPPEDYLDGQFAAAATHVLPQISLHASGGTLTEPHVYGRLGKAPVYGSVSAIQDIYDDIAAVGGASYPYPQVRFYARKYDTTTVPLKLDSTNVTGSGVSVQITPAEHDLLPEIVDGWKECTLRFPTAPSMGAVAGSPAWRFTSVGEQSGSQWQVLSACAPAVSGVPGSLLTQATPVHRLGVATYQPPAGDTNELTWLSPYATGAVVDPNCDAVLLFSQDPPAVTGLSLTQATQPVTGLADCASLPCCIVTGIGYNRLTWGLPVNTGIADDDYARTVAAGGWGTASDGKTWTVSGTATDFFVDGDEGVIDISATASTRIAWVDVGGPNQDVSVSALVDEAAESGELRSIVFARLTDASNYYRVQLTYDSAGVVRLVLAKRVAAVDTTLQTVVLGSLRPAQTTPRRIRLQVDGINIRAKAWDSDQPEPWWQITTTDTALATGNNAGVGARDETGAATSIWYFTEFTVRPPDFCFGGYELQRFDTRTSQFETIMLASAPAVTGFTDYEPRVGISSVYRIRRLNAYQFAGPWSGQVTGGPAQPGVSGNGTCNLTGGLMFTSNADQTGQHNCAYIMQWDGNEPVEGFNLPEASRVSYQELYGRDGRVAFHGTERGLETFTRELLIQQAAAVTSPLLANVTSLRELAFADLPYVCVRDDAGNRWYANVRVPNVSVRDDRSTYTAVVEIVETSTGPCIVDPAT